MNELAGYPVRVTLPVQWGDMDALGHVNNTVAIRWFESSRVSFLEQSGMRHFLTGKQLGPILASVSCNYRRQIVYPDTVEIGCRVKGIGRSSLTMQHVVFSRRADGLAADGESVVVVFDYVHQRPVRVPDEIRQQIEVLQSATP